MIGEVQHIASVNNLSGEGPLWSASDQSIYWVDITAKTFYRMDTSSGQPIKVEADFMIGVMRWCESGRLIMATRRGFVLYDLKTDLFTFLDNPIAGNPLLRFNDGATDRQGRFWAGTMLIDNSQDTKGAGSLYRLDPDGSLHEMEHDLIIPNGINWSPDQRTMYLTDSPRRVIYAYDFDLESGNISNRRDFIRYPESSGFPDGLCLDSEGYIWGAEWGGWRVNRFDPAGNKVQEIRLPTQCVTCCTFGGSNLDELYITTAREALTQQEYEQQPWAGDLFRVKLDVKGRLEPKFNDTAFPKK